MENVTDNIRVKIALDTQILAYLVDETYPKLTVFIKALSENKFVDIICSRFAIYEFIGIRKLEHYLRCLVGKATENGSKLNFSSALKYKNDFNAPELKYVETYETIKKSVEEELIRIDRDFGIVYENINLHSDLWKPHQELVLSTRISKEDSLLLLSSIFPDSFKKEDHLILLTNDGQFYKALEQDVEASNNVFEENGLTKSHTYYLKDILLGKSNFSLNLIDDNNGLTDDDVKNYVKEFIIEHIKKKNKDIFLGETIACECSAELKKKLLCFKLEDGQKLVENMYISILTKDFKLYNHPCKLSNFKCYGDIQLPYESTEDEKSKRISVELLDEDGDLLGEELMKNIISAGNSIFIHPDSDV